MWAGGTFYDGPQMPNLEIEDRVGGGDGFASGFIYGFLSGKSPQECVNLGVAHGALLMTTRGDTSMITLEELLHVAKGGSAGSRDNSRKEMNVAGIQTAILGACGEHYVASYLSGMGLVVALTRAGVPATDLIVTSETGGRSLSLQVKTGQIYNHVTYKRNPKENYWVWRVGKMALNVSAETHWYAFVSVEGWPHKARAPDVFFVPSKLVARTLRENNKSQREVVPHDVGKDDRGI